MNPAHASDFSSVIWPSAPGTKPRMPYSSHGPKTVMAHERRRAQLPRLLGATAPPMAQKAGGAVGAAKGPISLLQEQVQCSKNFVIPANYPVLQWTFDSQMADSATLEFRAIVAFLLEGVPHHVAGTWQPKKKDAQRDAAERALGLFTAHRREDVQVRPEGNPARAGFSVSQVLRQPEQFKEPVATLEEWCKQVDGCEEPPRWEEQWEQGACRSIVEVHIHGAPHQLSGAPAASEVAARNDTARRVLWYLRCPGFADAFDPDPQAPAIATMKIPAPPSGWAKEAVAEGALEAAERKTAVMRVQNRLQQKFSRQLRPGDSVWEWSYETDPNDESWPPLYRASVRVPVLGAAYSGEWARGQREAQLGAIEQVAEALAVLEGKECKCS